MSFQHSSVPLCGSLELGSSCALVMYFPRSNRTTPKVLPKNARRALCGVAIVHSAESGAKQGDHMKSVLQQANVFLF